MNFQFVALEDKQFEKFSFMDEKQLEDNNIVKIIVDKKPGFPCRVTLEDAEVGEEVFLFPYIYHNVKSPYFAEGPIFIRKNKMTITYQENDIPVMFHHRLLSLRGYNKQGMMKYAEVFKGDLLEFKINEFFENPEIEYLHVHNARPGCFNCKILRV